MTLPISADRDPLPDAAQRVIAALPIDYTGRSAPLAERMAKKAIPGVSIAVLEDGEVAWAAGFGVREAGRTDPVTPHTLFQAASISKPVTALAVMRFVQEGRLDLDADVNSYLTSWQVPANAGWQPRITLRQLLSHSAGTTIHRFVGYLPEGTFPTTREILDGLPPANTEPVRVDAYPGTISRYSGGGTTIVQQLLEDVTGRAFTDLMWELVLQPLGMTDSTYAQPLPEARWADAAHGHFLDGSPIANRWYVFPEQAAAGLWTTATDLLKVHREIQTAIVGGEGALLTKKSAETMFTHQGEGQYGIGFYVFGEGDQIRYGHAGDNVVYKADFVAFAHHRHAAAVLTNGVLGDELIWEIFGAVAREHAWPLAPGEWNGTFYQPHRPAHPSAETLEAFVGSYEARPEFTFQVRLGPDGLTLEHPAQAPISLHPVEESDTVFDLAPLEGEVRFERGDDGAVIALTLKQGYFETYVAKV